MEILLREKEFNSLLDQRYLEISKKARENSQYLVIAGFNYPIPLKKIELKGNIVHSISSFQMIQHYVNIENIPLETEFLFPKFTGTFIKKITCQFLHADGTSRIVESKIEEKIMGEYM